MITKATVSIFTAVAVLFLASPTQSWAESSNPTKTAKLLKKFKSLKPGAPFSQIQSFFVKLGVLDAASLKKYAKIANKLQLTVDQANKLNGNTVKIVKNAVKKGELPPSAAKKIEKKVDNTLVPVPTPTPYQASVGTVHLIQAA